MAIKQLKTTMSDVHSFDSLVKASAFIQSVKASARSMAAPHRYALKVISAADQLDRVRVDLLRKHYDIAQDFQGKLDLLDTLRMQLRYNFKGMNGVNDTLQQLDDLRTYITQRLDGSMDYIGDAAAKHMPQEQEAILDAVVSRLRDKVQDHCRSVDDSTRTLSIGNDDAKVFVRYVCLTQFKDDTGFVHPEYWLAFTCVVEAESTHTHCTSMSTYLGPYTFEPGAEFDGIEQGLDLVGELLDAENFSALSKRLPLPTQRISINELQTSKRWVVDVVVQDNEIKVKLAVGVGKAKVQSVVTKLTADIGGVLSKYLTGTLKYRTRWVGRQYQVVYTLVMPTGNKHKLITVEQLEGLRALGFDSVDVQRLQTTLNRG